MLSRSLEIASKVSKDHFLAGEWDPWHLFTVEIFRRSAPGTFRLRIEALRTNDTGLVEGGVYPPNSLFFLKSLFMKIDAMCHPKEIGPTGHFGSAAPAPPAFGLAPSVAPRNGNTVV